MLNLFIVAPYFPPSSLPPSQRIRLLMPYLQNKDVKVTIFTVNNKCREDIPDEWMEELAGNEYNRIIVKCIPNKFARFFGFGDLGLRIFPFLFFKLIATAKKHKNVFILFPVPPWNTLILVPLLRKVIKIKYAIDYIDPWIWEIRGRKRGLKEKISQWLAKMIEKRVVRYASVIFSVSEGINNQLLKRYSFLQENRLVAVPYGGEVNDYKYFSKCVPPYRNYSLIRYIGGIGPDMPPVANALVLSLKEVSLIKNIKVEFIGSSYAGNGLAKGMLTDMLNKYQVNDFIKEQPERVSYSKAVELSMNSDLLNRLTAR